MRIINIISAITVLIFTAKITLSNPEGNSLRRIRSVSEESEKRIEIPYEYRGVVKNLYADSETTRLEAIPKIVTIVIEKEKAENKRLALGLEIVKKLTDSKESIRESAALALRKILPYYNEKSQIIIGLAVVETGNLWGLKKIMPSLEQEPRRVVALTLVDKLASPREDERWQATQALGKVMDYLSYDIQKEVVLKMDANLTSHIPYLPEATARAFEVIFPLLKTKVIEDLAIDLRGKLERLRTPPPQVATAIAIVVEGLFPFLQNHNALKKELESEIRRLVPQP